MADQHTPDLADDIPSDGDLVIRCLAGRQDAFAALFDRYARQVYALVYRSIRNPTEAEDLTQDTFAQAFRVLSTLRQPQAFADWLYRVATSLCLDALRSRRAHPETPLDDAFANGRADESRWRSPLEAVLAGEEQRVVRAALDYLPPRYRAVLLLRELHGLPYADIARAMDTSPDAVSVLLFRARRRLREQYERADLLSRLGKAS